jgi:purine-binding chemotaxis protein CheW
VHGVIGLRGKIVPIVDLAGRLGLPSSATEPADGKVIILDADGGQLEAVPAAGTAVEAVAKLDDRLVMLLDATAFAAVGV